MSAFNILLVDDDQNLVTTLSHGLQKAMGEAIAVSVCFSSYEAHAMLATQAFDLVISDFDIPGRSGLELLSTIRQDHRETILILITAFGTNALEEELHELGIGYMTKPFELPLLVQFIQGLIRGAETAKTRDVTENAPLITDPDGDAVIAARLMRDMLLDWGDSNV